MTRMIDGVIVYDADGNVVFCNDSYRACYPEISDKLRPGAHLADILRAIAHEADIEDAKADLDSWVASRVAARLDPRNRTEIHYINGHWWEIHEYQAEDGTIVSQRRDVTRERETAIARVRGTDGPSEVPADSFAVYDKEGRIVATSEDYPALYPLVSDMIRPGTTLEELLRITAERAEIPEAKGRIDDWVREKVEKRLNPSGHPSTTRIDERWWQITEHRTAGGGVISIRSELSVAEEPAAESAQVHAMLADMVESLEDGFALFDKAGHLVLSNGRFQKLTRVPEAVLMPGATFMDILSAAGAALGSEKTAEAVEAWVAERMKYCSEGRPHEFRTNTGRWLRWHKQKAVGEHAICTIRDITDLKTRERALRASEGRYRKLVELSPDLSCVIAENLITVINSEGARLLGAETRSELAGAPLAEFVDDDFQDLVNDNLEVLAEEGGWVPLRLKRVDGTSFDAEVALIPFGLADTNTFMLFARDTTSRKRATAALLAREERLRGIMETVVDGIVVIDDAGVIESFNPAAEKVFGYDAEEVIGNNVSMLMPEPFASQHDAYLARYQETGKAQIIGKGREVLGRRKDGSVFPLELAVSEMTAEGQSLFIGVTRDITERKRYEQELQHAVEQAEIANRAKSEFLANMSHELRTPLNAIIGFSEAMQTGIFGSIDNDHYEGYIGNINDSGRHLLDVINDILDVSRIEAGKMDFHPEPVNAVDVAETCMRLIRERAESAGVGLFHHVDDDLPPLLSEGRRLKQILLNLLSNAVKFTPDGGEIGVVMRLTTNDGMEIRVSDTGIGMHPEDIPRALTPFSQVDSRLQRKYEGTGLGLPLSKAFVELHGGTLTLESAPEEGTTAVVYFPSECLMR